MLSKILRNGVGGRLSWWCPGCSMAHQVITEGHQAWEWNGDAEMPSFSPSVLVRWSSLSHEAEKKNADFKAKHGRWMTEAELPYDRHYTCHSFVRNGQMEFLGDCSHDLAGQTVPIPDWPRSRWE
jgi:hypothetical protein